MFDWLAQILGPGTELTLLFIASFLAGSIVPISSEVILFGILKLNATLFWPALASATAGNTLGGLSSYLLGRFLPEGKSLSAQTMHQRVQRFGAPILLLAWLPWIGDPLCVAAGWLRLNVWQCAVFMALGKFIRYWIVATAAR
jgi:membrane protein YqaA with SNARE-associated domain